MTTPWTPGPWKLREGSRVEVVSDRANIAMTFDGGTLAGEQQANARLIAAAPEMAELLAELLANKQAMAPPDWWYRGRILLSRIRGEDED